PSKRMSPRSMVAVEGRSLMMERRVVVLPEPDSPTKPSVSPSRTSRSTPRTTVRRPRRAAKTTRRPRISSSGLGSDPIVASTSAPNVPPAVADGVSDHAHGDTENHEHQARQRRNPPGGEQIGLTGGHDGSELGGGRLNAESEKRESGQQQKVDDDVDRGEDDARAEQVREGVAHDRSSVGIAERTSRKHELALPKHEHLAPGQSGIHGPAPDDDPDRGPPQAGTRDRD